MFNILNLIIFFISIILLCSIIYISSLDNEYKFSLINEKAKERRFNKKMNKLFKIIKKLGKNSN